MNSPLLKKALPHLIAIAVFLIIAAVYCRPADEHRIEFRFEPRSYALGSVISVESGVPVYLLLIALLIAAAVGLWKQVRPGGKKAPFTAA